MVAANVAAAPLWFWTETVTVCETSQGARLKSGHSAFGIKIDALIAPAVPSRFTIPTSMFVIKKLSATVSVKKRRRGWLRTCGCATAFAAAPAAMLLAINPYI